MLRDVLVGPVEQARHGMQTELLERRADLLARQLVGLLGRGPTVVAELFDDVVDLVDDPTDCHRGVRRRQVLSDGLAVQPQTLSDLHLRPSGLPCTNNSKTSNVLLLINALPSRPDRASQCEHPMHATGLA